MQTPSAPYTIRLLVPNMHCPSCVETITQLLTPIESISNLKVSILDRTITFVDSSAPSGGTGLRAVLDVLQREGGFHVETEDREPIQLPEESSLTGKAPWIRLMPGRLSRLTRSIKEQDQRQKAHLAHCEACRNNRSYAGPKAETTREVEVHAVEVHVKTTLSIAGMTCASCTQSISTALLAHDGIVSVDINLLASSAVVRHHSTLSPELVKAVIEDAGYEADIISSVRPGEKMRTIISIEGMTCASCSSTIDQAVRGVSGVDRVEIDLIGNRGVIVHANSITAKEICEVIAGVGYGPTLVSSKTLALRESEADERVVRISIRGMYCENCIVKLNAVLAALPVKSTPLTMQEHTTKITYTPRQPFTIRDLLREIAQTSPEFEAAVMKEPTLNDRSKMIQRREVRILSINWLVAFFFTIPTFVMWVATRNQANVEWHCRDGAPPFRQRIP